jgi:hypothetical protein
VGWAGLGWAHAIYTSVVDMAVSSSANSATCSSIVYFFENRTLLHIFLKNRTLLSSFFILGIFQKKNHQIATFYIYTKRKNYTSFYFLTKIKK